MRVQERQNRRNGADRNRIGTGRPPRGTALLLGLITVFVCPALVFAESPDQQEQGYESGHASESDAAFGHGGHQQSAWTDPASPNLPSMADSLADAELELDPDIDPGESGIPEDAEVQELSSGAQGKSGVSPQNLALPDGCGSMQGMGGSFTPNLNTGSGTYSVPVSLPFAPRLHGRCLVFKSAFSRPGGPADCLSRPAH